VSRGGWLAAIGPGVLVAATGVGAGDLATSALAGGRLGVGVAWAVVFGAVLKFALNEGLARWQLGTGRTLVETWASRRWFGTLLLGFLVLWGFITGGALTSAAGVAAHAMIPVFDDPVLGKRVWGIVQTLLAVVLVFAGGFRLFERAMSVCIGVMFVAVVYCALCLAPQIDPAAVHFVNPLTLRGDALRWTIGLVGGVGGTVTLLSYGYWIRESGRDSAASLPLCRLDLGLGYLMTALFGVGMMVIAAATPNLEGQGVNFLLALSARIGEAAGTLPRVLFVVGAWAAVFSSMLGVWQGVPYLFADVCRAMTPQTRVASDAALPRTAAYRFFLLWLALPPIMLLWQRFDGVVLAYAVLGAAFMPLVAASLLVLNRRGGTAPRDVQYSIVGSGFLVLALLFFLFAGAAELAERFD